MLFIGMGTEVFVFFISGFDRPFEKDEDEDPTEEDRVVQPGAVQMPQSVVVGGTAGEGATGAMFVGQPVTAAVPGGISAQELAAQAAGAQQMLQTVTAANQEMLNAAQATYAPEVEEALTAYVDQLKELTRVLGQVADKAARMTQDSVEMENLNRTLTGINTIYEMQLKSVSMQIGTIDRINDQTKKLAEQIEELNGVYGRMIKALTVNMKNASAGIGE